MPIKELDEQTRSVLIQKAREVRLRAYAPYSNYWVGAALLAENNEIYVGCNVENAAYGGSICAERSAALQAVAAGQRKFLAIAVVGGLATMETSVQDYAFPCGTCRQFLAEFALPDMVIILAKSETDYVSYLLTDLLPHCFGPGNVVPD